MQRLWRRRNRTESDAFVQLHSINRLQVVFFKQFNKVVAVTGQFQISRSTEAWAMLLARYFLVLWLTKNTKAYSRDAMTANTVCDVISGTMTLCKLCGHEHRTNWGLVNTATLDVLSVKVIFSQTTAKLKRAICLLSYRYRLHVLPSSSLINGPRFLPCFTRRSPFGRMRHIPSDIVGLFDLYFKYLYNLCHQRNSVFVFCYHVWNKSIKGIAYAQTQY